MRSLLTQAENELLEIVKKYPGRTPLEYMGLWGKGYPYTWAKLGALRKSGVIERRGRAAYFPIEVKDENI